MTLSTEGVSSNSAHGTFRCDTFGTRLLGGCVRQPTGVMSASLSFGVVRHTADEDRRLDIQPVSVL